MTTKYIYKFAHAQARNMAANKCLSAPDGYICTIEEPKKSREQEVKYHAMINEIVKLWVFMGAKQSTDDAKRIFIDAFARIKSENGEPLTGWGRIVPSIDGEGIVQLGIQSRNFRKREAAEFVEYLYAFGVEIGVEWSENSRQWDAVK